MTSTPAIAATAFARLLPGRRPIRCGVRRQQRNRRHQRNRGDVLEEQHARTRSRPIGVGVRLRSLIVCIAMAVDDSASARPATIAACNGSPSARPPTASAAPDKRELQRAAAEHRRAHRPKALRLELEADHEQHQHDAELGEMQDRLDVLDEPQSPGPDRDAGEEVPEDGAQTQPLRERHAQHRRGEIDQRVLHHGAAPSPPSAPAAGATVRAAPSAPRHAAASRSSSIAIASCTTYGGSQRMPQKRAVCSIAGT